MSSGARLLIHIRKVRIKVRAQRARPFVARTYSAARRSARSRERTLSRILRWVEPKSDLVVAFSGTWVTLGDEGIFGTLDSACLVSKES
jgi:hypothetical protein